MFKFLLSGSVTYVCTCTVHRYGNICTFLDLQNMFSGMIAQRSFVSSFSSKIIKHIKKEKSKEWETDERIWQAYGVTLRLLNPLAPSLTLCSFIHYALKIELYIRKQNEPIHCQRQITRSEFFYESGMMQTTQSYPRPRQKKKARWSLQEKDFIFQYFYIII